MQLREVPNNCHPVLCANCRGYLAFHPDDIDRIPEAIREHARLCPGPPIGNPPGAAQGLMSCMADGPVHCPCSVEDGHCCWCGENIP